LNEVDGCWNAEVLVVIIIDTVGGDRWTSGDRCCCSNSLLSIITIIAILITIYLDRIGSSVTNTIVPTEKD
jgi:hypothetical protein